VAFTIEAASQSGVFDHVYVSTEASEIARIAEAYGAEVPYRRPEELAGDRVTNVLVCLHLWETLRERGEEYDAICCLQPTSPLRAAEHIRGAWKEFTSGDYDFLVSVTPIDPHYFHWAVEKHSDYWRMHFGDRFLHGRFETYPVYRPNGAIKIARVDALRAHGNFFGERLGAYVMPESASLHIATRTDLDLCAAYLRLCDQPL